MEASTFYSFSCIFCVFCAWDRLWSLHAITSYKGFSVLLKVSVIFHSQIYPKEFFFSSFFFLKQFQTFISSRPANILLWKFRFCSVLVESIKRPCSAVLIEFLPYWQCTKACYWIFLFFLFFWNLGGIQQSHSMCQWNYCGLLRRYCSAMTATNILILHWIGCSLPTFFLAFSFLLAFVLLKGNEFRKVEVRK